MRSRDGAQTICVVCKPNEKPITKIAETPSPSPPTISSPSYTPFTEIEKCYSPAYIPYGDNLVSSESEALQIISMNILRTLSNALSCTNEIDKFCSLIESALKSLKAIGASSISSKDDYYINIHKNVYERLQVPCKSSVTRDIIKYFADTERLYTLFQEFNSILKIKNQ